MSKQQSTVIYGLVAALAVAGVLLFVIRANSEPPLPDYKLDTMHQLARFDRRDVIENEYQQLVDQGAELNKVDEYGCTPLYHAVFHDNLTAVEFMLEHGADPNLCENKCSAPIIWASRGVKPENGPIVEALIAAGAEVNSVDRDDGRTPLHFAAMNGSFEIVQLLIKAGADVNAVDPNDKNAPLHGAVERGRTKVVDLLLSSGADPELRNNWGMRPIDRVEDCPDPEEVQAVFRAHGADDQPRPELIKEPATPDE